MHVALDGGDHDLALGLDVATGVHRRLLLGLDVRQQMGDGLLHHPGRLDHLRQEHLALAEQVADDVHAGHQRAFDHMQRPTALCCDALPAGFSVLDDEVGDAVHQRMAQPRIHRVVAPGQAQAVVLGRALDVLGNLQQTLGGILAAVQHHVLHPFAQLGIELVVDAHHAGIDDAHVQPGLDRVVQEHGVNGFAHRLVAAEAEADVAHATRDLGTRQVGLDPARRVDEVDRVVGMLLDAGGDREDVGVEDDVFGRETHHVDQDAVGPLADRCLALKGVGLSKFVEGHHDGGRAVAPQQRGLALELGLALLERNAVDDALALDALQPGLDHAPLAAVDHDRHPGDLGLAGDQLQEALHRSGAVEHGLVHVDVDHLGAVLDLLARHAQGVFVTTLQDHPRESLGAGDVGALADVDEQAGLADGHRL